MKNWVITPDKFMKDEEVRKLKRWLEEREAVALLKGTTAPVRARAILETALGSGLRVSELCGIRIKDVYIGRGEHGLFVVNGKGNKARLVNVSNDLRKVLKDYISWKQLMGEDVSPEAYLFKSERRQKMSPQAIQKIFKKCARAVDLPANYSIHTCRHTFATALYRQTKDLRYVQKQLGHSKSQVTEVYAHVIDSDHQKALDNLYKETGIENGRNLSNSAKNEPKFRRFGKVIYPISDQKPIHKENEAPMFT